MLQIQRGRAMRASSFADRAKLVTRYGVPVVPLRPRTKIACLTGWENLATTDEAQIAKWNAQNSHYNCAAVAQAGGFWIWDVDNPSVFAQLKKETGHDIEEVRTLVVKSSGEKRHLYFKHDERSKVIGNQDCDLQGKEAFSVRANNRYVVAPGSIHPETGEPYEIISEPALGEMLAAPLWLTDWMMRCTARPQSSQTPVPERCGRCMTTWEVTKSSRSVWMQRSDKSRKTAGVVTVSRSVKFEAQSGRH